MQVVFGGMRARSVFAVFGVVLGLWSVTPVWAEGVLSCSIEGGTAVAPSRTVRHGGHKATSLKRLAAPPPVYPAHVVAVQGDVRLLSRGGGALAEGAVLLRDDVVETQAGAFVSLRFGDGSINVLPPNARLKLSQVSSGVAQVVLLKGSVESRVTKSPNARKNTFEILLPTVSIGVRGTHFRVALDEQKGERVEVEEGVVKVASRSVCTAPLTLTAGQGAWVSTRETSVLLEAPELMSSDEPQRGRSRWRFDLKPLIGATRYHVQVANDQQFLDIWQEAVSTNPDVVMPNRGALDGFYYVRVSGVDSNGLEGRTKTHLFLTRKTSDESE